jgi:dephospho-CoA kinase
MIGRRRTQVIGLTGSIGMGKSTAAAMLRRMGLPLHDADAAVHRLLGPGGGAVEAVAAAFPATLAGNAIDRRRLGALVFQDRPALKKLESILHPRVRQMAEAFIRLHRRRNSRFVVLDVPLLFETGGGRLCDHSVVITAPLFLQQARVLARPGMTLARLEAIRAQQMPEWEKCRRADFVVQNGLSKGYTYRQLAAIVAALDAPNDC